MFLLDMGVFFAYCVIVSLNLKQRTAQMEIKNKSGRKSTEMFNKNVENVRRIFEANPGLTQREVAEIVGLHVVTVNKIVKHLRGNKK